MWGRLERAFILSEEEHLHECSVELAGHVKDLNDRLKKMDEDVYRGELQTETVYIIVRGTVEKSVGWEENLAKNEETL